MINLKQITALALVLSLTACGGGGSDDSTASNPEPIPPTGGNGDGGGGDDNTVAATISGKVIDGYVSGATVFVDINGNGVLDNGEPSSESTDKGEYILEIGEADEDVMECITYAPVVVNVPVGAIDEDLGEVEEAYTMTLPPLNEDSFDSAHITPLTSVLWGTFKNDFALKDENADPALACEELLNNHELISQFKGRLDNTVDLVVENYNISREAIYSDFVAKGDVETYDLAQKIVKGLKMSLTESQAIVANNPNASPIINYLKQDDEWVREEYIFTRTPEVTEASWSDDSSIQAKTQIVSSDFEQRFETIFQYQRNSSFKRFGESVVQVSYYLETCNSADQFEWTGDVDGDATQIVEIVNNYDNCIDQRSKLITVRDYHDVHNRLGESYSYTIDYDSESNTYGKFGYMKDFYDTRNSLNVNSIVNDLTAESFTMSQDYDPAVLLETYGLVETRVREMDGDNLVDTRRTYNSPEGATWERRTTYPDGTHKDECKDIGETTWSSCNN